MRPNSSECLSEALRTGDGGQSIGFPPFALDGVSYFFGGTLNAIYRTTGSGTENYPTMAKKAKD
jgi:hypothetical protein